MLSIPSLVKVFLHVEPVNLHFGFDRLAGLAREEMGQDPLSGHLFVFRNRRGDRVKLLFWDVDGLVIYYKRLERGVFKFPPAALGAVAATVSVSDLSLLLCGIDPLRVQRQKRYTRPA
jgi:transposase